MADTTRMTLTLPVETVRFAATYAEAHGLTVTEVIGRYLGNLRRCAGGPPSDDIKQIGGLTPTDIDEVDGPKVR